MKKHPHFLTLEMILAIHKDQIKRYGGSLGVREKDGLQSALHMPQSGFGDEFFHKDLFEMAAAYLFHITQGHPFIDGNKRVGAVAAWLFLYLNGIVMDATEESYEKLVMDVANGRADKQKIAQFFRKHSASN